MKPEQSTRNPNHATDVTFYDNSKCHFQTLNLQHEYIFKCSISIHYNIMFLNFGHIC